MRARVGARPRMGLRARSVRALGTLLLAVALLGGSLSPPAGASDAALMQQACANLTPEVLERVQHGIMLGRSGDIQIIPTFPNFVNTGLSHATPYDYTQDVPLLVYGPGYVRPGVYAKPVTLTDIAPTTGALLRFPFDPPDGTSQKQILLPDRPAPRLVVTLVWDSGGMDVIDEWRKDMPYFESLVPQGAWFSHASVGASPSNTPPGHSEIGTGAFPMHNGFVDDWIRIGNDILHPNDLGPGLLVLPTFGDIYDRAMGNEPIVGAVVSLAAHVMMMSHGAMWGGGDRDIAITRQFNLGETSGQESPEWAIVPSMKPYYTFPAYANSLPPVSAYTRDVDALDGAIDGLWRGSDIQQLKGGFDTPARTPYQTKLLKTVIDREGFGQDDVTDLLYVNYKAIDTVGHYFSLNSPEMDDTMIYQDTALREFVDYLNQKVGEGQWVMFLTADHGTQYSPEVSGAFLIDIGTFKRALIAAFDDDKDGVELFTQVRPTQLWVDHEELADNGFTLTDIAEYIMSLTQSQTIKAGVAPDPATANDPVFSAALPTASFLELPCLPEAGTG